MLRASGLYYSKSGKAAVSWGLMGGACSKLGVDGRGMQ